MLRRFGTWFACLVILIPVSAFALDDWDLYMLRLVNRARQDPAGEPARIGSSVTDPSTPQLPLAYESLLGTAATNHNNWMHDNFGSLASGLTPDSSTHFETTNGAQFGPPATGTPNYTGADPGARFTAAGFVWDRSGENISAAWSTATLPVNQARIDANHKGWWESTPHRTNMLGPNFSVFGHHVESRTFTPPRGGLASPFDNLNYATQDYARPFATTKTYVLGLLYRDLDANGVWTPRNTGDPLREGLSGKTFQVFNAGTNTTVMAGSTLSNGAFSINIANGSYDIQFTDATGTPTGKLRFENITVSGQNVDAGDRNTAAIARADFDGDGHVDAADLAVFAACRTRPGLHYNTAALPPGCPQPYQSTFIAPDFNHDNAIDMSDFAVFQRCYSGAMPANPACG